MKEIWRDINVNGYEGLYKISNLGNARSLDQHCKGKNNSVRIRHGKPLKPIKNKGGYLLVKLPNGIKFIHRLVAMTFPDLVDWTEDAKGKPFEELQINHKDENPANNRVDNLEWCTASYNINYGNRNKKCGDAHRGINNRSSSKPVLQYTLDMVFVAEYPSGMEAYRQTGVRWQYISLCCKGQRKSAGGYIWKFK